MVTILALFDHFKSADTISKIKPFDDAKLLQQLHRAIYSGQIALASRKGRKDSLVAQGTEISPKDLEDGLPGGGQLP